MTCYHPLKCFYVGENHDTGKNKTQVTPFDVQYIYKEYGSDGFSYSYEPCCWNYEKCFEDKRLCDPSHCDNFIGTDARVFHLYTRFVPIPCGKCLGCRIDQARDWTTRMMLEQQYSLSSWFVTLTYSPEAEVSEITPFEWTDKNGKLRYTEQFPIINDLGLLTLNKDDYVRFNKRLLEKSSDRLPDDKHIRFFLCGEYGEQHGRPHMHGIYFNLMLRDDELKPYFRRNGIQYYRSPVIEELWPFGMVIIGAVTYDSCSYVARYTTKKFFDDPESYDEKHKMKEFTAMSRRPGLGREWFDDNFEKLYSTYIINLKNGKQVSVPKYFYKLLQEKDPEKFVQVHERNLILGRNAALGSISETDKGYLDYLADLEYKFKHNPKPKFKAWLSRERIKDAPTP